MAVRGRKQGSTNTGYRGISLKKNGTYEARIVFNVRGHQTNTYLGVYPTLAEAVRERTKFLTSQIA